MTFVLAAIAVYLAAGLVFSIIYILRLAPAADPALGSSPAHVRLLLVPAAAALWPLLLVRSLGARGAS